MFPQNQFYTTVTLFTPHHNTDDNTTRFYRRIIRRCYLKTAINTASKTAGTASPENVKIIIPLKYNGGYGKRKDGVFTEGYINRDDWVKLPADGVERFWTVRTGGSDTHRSVFLCGEIEFPELEVWQDTLSLEGVYRQFTQQYGTAMHFPGGVEELLIGFKNDYMVNCDC